MFIILITLNLAKHIDQYNEVQLEIQPSVDHVHFSHRSKLYFDNHLTYFLNPKAFMPL
jgi:hypothetical protein